MAQEKVVFPSAHADVPAAFLLDEDNKVNALFSSSGETAPTHSTGSFGALSDLGSDSSCSEFDELLSGERLWSSDPAPESFPPARAPSRAVIDFSASLQVTSDGIASCIQDMLAPPLRQEALPPLTAECGVGSISDKAREIEAATVNANPAPPNIFGCVLAPPGGDQVAMTSMLASATKAKVVRGKRGPYRKKHKGAMALMGTDAEWLAGQNFTSPDEMAAFLDQANKMYRCMSCDYTSLHSSNLHRHIRSVHTGEKPYQCDMCDYASAHSNNLKRHVRRHHLKMQPQGVELPTGVKGIKGRDLPLEKRSGLVALPGVPSVAAVPAVPAVAVPMRDGVVPDAISPTLSTASPPIPASSPVAVPIPHKPPSMAALADPSSVSGVVGGSPLPGPKLEKSGVVPDDGTTSPVSVVAPFPSLAGFRTVPPLPEGFQGGVVPDQVVPDHTADAVAATSVVKHEQEPIPLFGEGSVEVADPLFLESFPMPVEMGAYGDF